MATIYDIAKIADVSPMTVSRVLNNKKNISDATRKKVLKAAEELNYIPNLAARSLQSKKSSLLALLITDITNPFFLLLSLAELRTRRIKWLSNAPMQYG